MKTIRGKVIFRNFRRFYIPFTILFTSTFYKFYNCFFHNFEWLHVQNSSCTFFLFFLFFGCMPKEWKYRISLTLHFPPSYLQLLLLYVWNALCEKLVRALPSNFLLSLPIHQANNEPNWFGRKREEGRQSCTAMIATTKSLPMLYMPAGRRWSARQNCHVRIFSIDVGGKYFGRIWPLINFAA